MAEEKFKFTFIVGKNNDKFFLRTESEYGIREWGPTDLGVLGTYPSSDPDHFLKQTNEQLFKLIGETLGFLQRVTWEERNEQANKIDCNAGSVRLSGGEGEGSASHCAEAER